MISNFYPGGRVQRCYRACLDLMRDRDGIAALELAVVAPILFLMMFGVIQIGLTFCNYLLLTNAAITGAQTLSISRGTTTPFSATKTAMTSAASTLTTATLSPTVTTKINGVACATDVACTTALNTATGQSAVVTTTYPCNLTIMGVNFAPGCTLTAQAAQMVQ
jgi:Flp pilus assembly protein TadG